MFHCTRDSTFAVSHRIHGQRCCNSLTRSQEKKKTSLGFQRCLASQIPQYDGIAATAITEDASVPGDVSTWLRRHPVIPTIDTTVEQHLHVSKSVLASRVVSTCCAAGTAVPTSSHAASGGALVVRGNDSFVVFFVREAPTQFGCSTSNIQWHEPTDHRPRTWRFRLFSLPCSYGSRTDTPNQRKTYESSSNRTFDCIACDPCNPCDPSGMFDYYRGSSYVSFFNFVFFYNKRLNCSS